MELKKEPINLMEQCVKLNANVCVEGDIVVPDIKPDIREILLADANAITQTCEYRNGKLKISGMVFFKILYCPDKDEASGEVKALETSFAFTDSVDIPSGEAMKFFVQAETEHIGFTLVNSRKLSAKVIVSLGICGYQNNRYEPVSEIVDDKVQCRQATYNMDLPMAEVQSEFKVSDFLTVPAQMPDIDEILKMDAWASGAECKIMNGKVMVKGTLHVKTLYTAADENSFVQVVSHEIPFTEIVEAEGVDENCDVCASFFVRDVACSARGDMNGDTKIINTEVLLCVVLKPSKTMKATMVDDCYSVQGNLKMSKETIHLAEFVASEQAEFSHKQMVKMANNEVLKEVVHVSCKPIVREVTVAEDALHVRGTVVSFLLYREDKEHAPIKSAVTETEFDWHKPMANAGDSADCNLWVEDVTATKINGESAEVVVTLGIFVHVYHESDATVLTDCEEAEGTENGHEKPSLVICFTEEGDTLWTIAKRYGTTVDKIKAANGLETDKFAAGEKLLIPKAC